MSETTIEIGGNSVSLWYGRVLSRLSKYYERRSDMFIEKGKKTIIANPVSKLINPFTLLISFTVNSSDKYQLITQGDYKNKYREVSEGDVEYSPITNDEMFYIIRANQDKWFLKQ